MKGHNEGKSGCKDKDAACLFGHKRLIERAGQAQGWDYVKRHWMVKGFRLKWGTIFQNKKISVDFYCKSEGVNALAQSTKGIMAGIMLKGWDWDYVKRYWKVN